MLHFSKIDKKTYKKNIYSYNLQGLLDKILQGTYFKRLFKPK